MRKAILYTLLSLIIGLPIAKTQAQLPVDTIDVYGKVLIVDSVNWEDYKKEHINYPTQKRVKILIKALENSAVSCGYIVAWIDGSLIPRKGKMAYYKILKIRKSENPIDSLPTSDDCFIGFLRESNNYKFNVISIQNKKKID